MKMDVKGLRRDKRTGEIIDPIPDGFRVDASKLVGTTKTQTTN